MLHDNYRWEKKTSSDPDSASDGFCPVHPDRGAEEIPCISITTGLNADFTGLPETAYVRCRKCGFIMNKARHPKGWGDGNTASPIDVWSYDWGGGLPSGTSGYSGVGYPQVAGYPITTAGCPFCGTFIYD